MDSPPPRLLAPTVDARHGRRHRFMESTDINAAFRALFVPLRMQIRRGMTNKGEVYGIEMDGPAMVVTIRQGAGFPDGGRLIWELTESADGKTAWRCRAQRLPAPTLPEDCR